MNNYLVLNYEQQYDIDKSKVELRTNKIWGIKDNRELAIDKNWEQARGLETKPVTEE